MHPATRVSGVLLASPRCALNDPLTDAMSGPTVASVRGVTHRSDTPRLPLWLTAIIWLVAFAIVMTVTFIITSLNADAEQRDFAQRSGSTPVVLSGQLETAEVLVSAAQLITSAEFEETTVEVSLTRKPDSYHRSPIVRVEFEGLVCQTGRSWLWSDEINNTLTLRCDRFISKRELADVGIGDVQMW